MEMNNQIILKFIMNFVGTLLEVAGLMAMDGPKLIEMEVSKESELIRVKCCCTI